MSEKQYISKIAKDGNNLYIKDTEARQSISSHAGNTSNPHSVTKSQIGLGNVTNHAQVKRSEMGVASGVATLDTAGKVPTSQLPSYVDDVLEYDTKSAFPTTGEAGKIYVDKSTNTTWRWSGSAYTQIKGDLVIGTTTGTAADGGVANTHYNNTSNPHSVTKAQVGLGSVVNTGDSATPVSGGTTKFTTGGAYTELNKKVDKVSGKGLSTNDYTTNEKNKLSGIESGAQANIIETVKVNGTALTPSSKAVNVTVPTKTSELTNNSNFVSDASYVHTDNNYTATEKSKLNGIASGAEVNQNTFSNVGVKVGNTTTTVAADAKTDTITLIQGSNITLTPDATNDTVTIAATDTKYTAATAAPGKVATSSAQGSSTNYARQDHTHGIDLATGDANGQVKIAGTNVSVKGLGSAAYTASTAYATNQQLASDANLNNIKTVGFYNAGGGNTITNKPSGVEHFGMEVIHYASGDYYVQIVYNNSNSWRRRCDNGTWGSWVQDKLTDTTYSAATTSAAGLMSADDKTKLNGIATGATKVTTDTVSGWGYTKNTGTITGIKMNGASKGTSGVVDLGTVITAHQDISGKVDKTTTVNGHALSGNVSVTKSDVGLGNVGNFKAVSTVASQGLSNTEKANARTNIGAGTSSFSGNYNDLSNKPTIPAAANNGTFSVKTKVGSNDAMTAADFTANQSSADDVTFIQGSNTTLTTDTTNRTITIASADTKNTAGSTDSSSKLFIVGATSQAANPQTYSQDTAYVGTDGHLYSNSKKVLNVAGGVLESLNGITSTANSSTKVLPSASALSQSPIPKYLWHDLFALCRNCTPTYYTSTDNSTWTQATLDKRHFSLKDGFSKTVIPTTGVKGVRWLWSNSGLGYGCGTWLVINFTYSPTQATYTVLFESSSNGTTWTTRHSSSGSDCQRPIWHYVGDLGKDSYFRLTITKDTSDTTKNVNVGAIKLLSYRWGDQGKGSEYEYPYDWDADGNIFSISAGNRDLGATNNYWKNLYVTNINGVAVGSSPKFTDTTYSSKSAESGGTDVSLVTTGEKYTWNSKTSNTGTVTSVAVKMNGASKGTVTTSGTIDLGTVLTSHQDISGKQDKVAKLGSSTKPLYTSAAGTFTECSTYAGGTAVTLNGTSKAASTASLYAPTSAGTAGQILVSSAGAPDWKTGEILHYITSPSGTAGSTTSGARNRTQWTGTLDGVTTLYTGLTILYKVAVAGVSAGVTLNLSSSGEHPVVRNANTGVSTNYPVGAIIPLTYDADQKANVYVSGTSTEYTGCWKVADYDANTTYSPLSLGFCYGTCSTAAGTAAKVVTMSSYALVAHGIVSIRFNNAITVASATLNINSKGAKAIYYKNAALAANVIQAGDIVTMQYNGSQYHIISIIRNSGLLKTDFSSEVQESLTKADETRLSTAYIGVGASVSAVTVAANLKSNLRRGAKTSVTASSNKLWVLTPSTYADPTVLMGGVEVPMTAQSNTTVSGVTYKTWSSNNTYTGTFNVVLL